MDDVDQSTCAHAGMERSSFTFVQASPLVKEVKKIKFPAVSFQSYCVILSSVAAVPNSPTAIFAFPGLERYGASIVFTELKFS